MQPDRLDDNMETLPEACAPYESLAVAGNSELGTISAPQS